MALALVVLLRTILSENFKSATKLPFLPQNEQSRARYPNGIYFLGRIGNISSVLAFPPADLLQSLGGPATAVSLLRFDGKRHNNPISAGF